MISRRRFLLAALIFSTATLSVCRGQGTYQAEAERLATLLGWHAGSVVAEIGAGAGQMSVAAAQHVGPTGHVYTTELDSGKLAHLEELASQEKFHNLTAIQAAQTETNLPPACCDSIFMRHVYHHFTDPARIDASLFRSLKAGGLIAVIDFPPRRWLPRAEGVPKNRGGHGMPESILIEEMTAAGFQVVSTPADWPGDDYCVVFRKPGPVEGQAKSQ
jgi:ubiquinone/menaquinone biosynthesis C-methylase UbiE